MLILLVSLLSIASSLAASNFNFSYFSSNSSLCDEQVARQSGFLHGLYYIAYESAAGTADPETPVILWLSGGPGCSGLVAALFELGPCSFNDETQEMALNPYAWTNVAHVVFVDQPKGTGFSVSNPVLMSDSTAVWTERQAMKDLGQFLDLFFTKNVHLRANPFFIFGESFGGHYAPDLARFLLESDPDRAKWAQQLHGVGIGNGVVSPIAGVEMFLDFALHNAYDTSWVAQDLKHLQQLQQQALKAARSCQSERRSNATQSPAKPSPVCHEAAQAHQQFDIAAVQDIVKANKNMYDIRRSCHSDDPLGLCYRFSRLQRFVNSLTSCSTWVSLSYRGISVTRRWDSASRTSMNTKRAKPTSPRFSTMGFASWSTLAMPMPWRHGHLNTSGRTTWSGRID